MKAKSPKSMTSTSFSRILRSSPAFCSSKSSKKFTDQVEATQAAVSLTEGKAPKTLKKMLKKLVNEDVIETLAVADTKVRFENSSLNSV
jgi:hypothetical protein